MSVAVKFNSFPIILNSQPEVKKHMTLRGKKYPPPPNPAADHLWDDKHSESREVQPGSSRFPPQKSSPPEEAGLQGDILCPEGILISANKWLTLKFDSTIIGSCMKKREKRIVFSPSGEGIPLFFTEEEF